MTKISEPSCHLKKRQELPGNACATTRAPP